MASMRGYLVSMRGIAIVVGSRRCEKREEMAAVEAYTGLVDASSSVRGGALREEPLEVKTATSFPIMNDGSSTAHDCGHDCETNEWLQW